MLWANQIKKVAHRISTTIFTLLEILGLPRIPNDRVREKEKAP